MQFDIAPKTIVPKAKRAARATISPEVMDSFSALLSALDTLQDDQVVALTLTAPEVPTKSGEGVTRPEVTKFRYNMGKVAAATGFERPYRIVVGKSDTDVVSVYVSLKPVKDSE